MTNKEFIRVLRRFPSGAVLKGVFMEYDDVTLDIIYTDKDGVEFSICIPILTEPPAEETPEVAAPTDEKTVKANSK